MNNIHWRTALSGPLGISLLAIVVAIGIVFLRGPGVLSALFTASARDATDSSVKDELLASHTDTVKNFRDRVAGRSPFFVPPPPPSPSPVVPKPPQPPTVVADTGPKPPPKPPENYSGPALMGVLGSRVYFAGLKVDLGEEKDGVKVLEIDAPWSVKVAHKNGTYDVPLLKSDLLEGFTKPYDGTGLPQGTESYDSSSAPGFTSNGDDEPPAAKPPGGRGGRFSPPSAPPRESGRSESARGEKKPADPADAPPRRGANEESSSEDASQPAPISKDTIDTMSRGEALEALGEVTKWRKKSNLDQQTKDRLKEEFDLLMAKVKQSS